MSEIRKVNVAVVQTAFAEDIRDNVDRTMYLVSEAADAGANVVVVPELFEGGYFCKHEDERFFDLAQPLKNHPTIGKFQQLCAQRRLVVPVSFFERDGQSYYNSIAMVDGDGSVLGVYRKSHIPDGPGYEEKFYFRPGDTGFRAWETCHGVVGAGICWDQWFPEAARAMVLQGAEVLVYPSAIGSEPDDPDLDTRKAWQRVMQGHAVANVVPLAAANRVGNENGQTFYGHSFVCDHRGEIVDQVGDGEHGFAMASFDLAEIRRNRASFGLFRDRRCDLYGSLVGGSGLTAEADSDDGDIDGE